MKPTATVDVRTIGDFGDDTRKVKMGIDAENQGFLLSLLIDMYSDQILAVLREYSTNALDSHKAAKVARPIEVTLPSVMSPFLKIRDFGLGLSADDVIDTYSKYGSSTKRDSDEFNGMLGIGAKSALTYTNQFTITSVKDGEKIIIVVSRVGHESNMEIISTGTGVREPNGVEISVPIRGNDIRTFAQKAEHLYSFWTPGTVLVNGRQPARIDLKMVTPTIGTTTRLGYDVVVMGNVPYPVERRLFDGRRSYGNNFDVVAFVEIGEVQFTPSRESLMFTRTTDATVARIKAEFAAKIRATIVADIDAAPTHAEAYRRSVKWSNQYGSVMPNPVSYKGTVIPTTVRFDFDIWNPSNYGRQWSKDHQAIDIKNLIDSVVIHGFDLKGLTSTHKEKIRKWKNDNGIAVNRHLFTAAPAGDPWVDPKHVISWEDIKKIVLPSKGPKAVAKKPTVDVYDAQGYTKPISDLDPNKIPAYISPTARIGASEARMIYSALDNVQIVSLGENRWEKFKRENPTALPLKDVIAAEYVKARDALTPNDIKALSADYTTKRCFEPLDPAKINDPDLSALVSLVKNAEKSPTLVKYRKAANLADRYGVRVQGFVETDYSAPYPLLLSAGRGTLSSDHAHIYLNAVFAANV